MSFQDLRDEALAAVDDVFAEEIKLSFLKNGIVDPARPAVTIGAILRDGTEQSENVSGGDRAEWNSRASAAKASLHIDRATYAGPAIRKGDRVQARERTGQPWYSVTAVDDRSGSRMIVFLGEA